MHEIKQDQRVETPFDKLMQAVQLAEGFFQFSRVLVKGTVQARIFALLYDNARFNPKGMLNYEIQADTGIPQAEVSNALAALRRRGFVVSDREGHSMRNAIPPDAVQWLDGFAENGL